MSTVSRAGLVARTSPRQNTVRDSERRLRRTFNRSKTQPEHGGSKELRATAEACRYSRSHHRYWSLSLFPRRSLSRSLPPAPASLSRERLRHSLFTMDGIKTALYRDILRDPLPGWECNVLTEKYPVCSFSASGMQTRPGRAQPDSHKRKLGR